MKNLHKLLMILLISIGGISMSYGQITISAGTTTMCTMGDTILMPVNVTNFNGIGSITMRVTFDPTKVEYLGIVGWPGSFNGMLSGPSNPNALGYVNIAWGDYPGKSFGSGKLFDLKFRHISGTTSLGFPSSVAFNEIKDEDDVAYTVVYTNGAINQGVIPVATITASGALTFCNGDSVRLNATTNSGFSYQWIKDNVDISGATADSLWVKVAGSYTLKVTAFCGNITSTATVVTVNDVPAAAGTITGAANVCLNTTGIAYSVPAISGATGYIWTLPAGASIATGSNTNSITVDFNGAAVSGNITVQGTNACGNGLVSANFAITMNDKPVAAGTISGSSAVCQGTNGVAFSVPVISAASSYTWTLPTGATVATGANTESITVDFANNATSGVFTVKGENLCGFGTVSADYSVTVNGTPDATVTTTGSTTFCNGDSVKFAVVNDVNYTYAWYEGTNLMASETSSIYYAKVAGSYKVAITNTVGGCSKTSTANTVTVNALPTASTTLTTATICSGDSVELNFSLTGTAPFLIVGNDGSGNMNFNAAASPWKTWVKPTAALTTYSIVSITDANNCSNTSLAATAVTVNPTPTVTITQPAGVCSPTTVDLTSSAITNGSTASLAYTYWTDMAATVAYTSPTNAATGTYYIKGTTTLGCYDIESVTVSNNPTPTVNITNPADVCSPATVDLTLPAVTNTSTANLIYTYWTDLNATTAYTTATAATAGTYYIKGATTEGCFTIQPVTVTVNPTPTVVINQPAGVCSPTTVDLTVSAITNGSTAGLIYTYWTNASATTAYTTPTNAATGKYYIKGSTTLGCYDIDSVTVSNNPTPTVSITNPAAVCSPATVNLTSAAVTTGSTSGLIFTYWTDVAATTAYTTPTTAGNGTYYIKGATTQGCFAIQPVVVTVNTTPTVMITNPSAVCAPNTVDITLPAVTAGSTTGLIYTYWTNAGATTTYTTPTTAGNGTFYIKGATATCSAIQPVTVVVNALPTVTFASMPNDICVSAAPVNLTGTPVATIATLTCTSNCALPVTCTAGSNSSSYEYITNVSLNGASQTSVGTTYSDYTATQFTQLFKDSTYTLSGTLTTDGPDFLIAYIDWDRDGIFSTTDSIYINNYPGAATGATFTKSITVPSSAVLGDVKMRIMFAYSSIPSSCATVSYGEVEDYKINIAAKGSNGVFSGVGISGTTFNPATAGVGGWYVGTYTYTNANGCTNTAKDSSMVRALPTIAFTNLNAAYCENGSSVTLAATPAGGTFSGIGITGTTFNPTIPSVGTTKVFYTATSAYSCVKTDSQSVIINAKPVVTLTGLASSYCIDGTPSTLSGSPIGGIYAGTGVTGASFNPTTAGAGNHQVLYSYTDANSCSNSMALNAIVNALPTITFATVPSVCIDATPITLGYATPTGGTYSGIGITAGNFTPSVAGVGAKYIKYAYTDPTTTCSKTDSTTIVVNALPVISITGASSPYCLNALNDTLVGAPANGTFTGVGMTADVFSPSTAGVGSHYIKYSATDANLCSNMDSISVSVIALPVVAITNLSSAYCVNGIDTTILATPAGGTFSGNGMVANTFKPSTLSAGPVAITYTYTDATTNCTNEVIGNTTVYAAPVVNLGNDTAACVTYTIDAGTGFTNYLWSTGATTQTINVTASNTYIAGVVDNHLCYNTDTVVVTINSLPVFNLGNDTIVKIYPYLSFTPGYAPVTLTAPAGMTSYLWSTGATTQSIAVDTTGLGVGHAGIKNVWVKVTNSNGCDYTDTIAINFQDNTGISQITKSNFRVYPNPNNGLFTIEVNNTIENATFKLLDVTGKEIMSENIDFSAGLTKDFDVRSLSKGVYFVRIINENNVNTIRIVVQ